MIVFSLLLLYCNNDVFHVLAVTNKAINSLILSIGAIMKIMALVDTSLLDICLSKVRLPVWRPGGRNGVVRSVAIFMVSDSNAAFIEL